MLNINQHNASLDFNFSTNQLKEIISTDNTEVMLSNTEEYYDLDEVSNADEDGLEKQYLCLKTYFS